MPLFGNSPTREATVRVLPITTAADAVKRLSRLNVGQCNNLSFAGVKHWRLGEFCAVIEACTHLTSEITAIEFSNMGLDANFLSFAIDLIKRCPNLKRLDMEGNYFGGGCDALVLLEGLKNTTASNGLGSSSSTYASAGDIGSVISAELGDALKDKRHIVYINLTSCVLTDAAAISFLKAMLGGTGSKSSSSTTPFLSGFTLHLSHNSLSSTFATEVASIVSLNNPQSHPLNGIMLYGNFISNEANGVLQKGCERRRQMVQKGQSGASDSNNKVGHHAVNAARTSLGLLIQCASEADGGNKAFPTIAALVKILGEEGM